MDKQPITVLGSGSWGTALALVLADVGQPVRLWGMEAKAMIADGENRAFLPGISFPDNLEVYSDLTEAVSGVQDILIVVPSQVFAEQLRSLKPIVESNVRIAWATKGLGAEPPYLLHDIIRHEMGEDVSVAVLSGPTFATEVAKKVPSALDLAASDESFGKALAERFQTDYFTVHLSDDVVGVSLGGTVKNVIAIAAGISDGLGLGANTRFALITSGLREIIELGLALGAQAETFSGLSGLGDLMLTCSDDQSRNRRFGLMLGQGKSTDEAEKTIGQVVEGMKSTPRILNLAKMHGVKMPIVEYMHQVLYEGCSVDVSDINAVL